jgi:Flp pilus assembly protein TadD
VIPHRGYAFSRKHREFRLPATACTVFLLALLLTTGCATRVSRRELAEEYFNLGNAYFDLQDYDRSYHYYQRAIALSDEVPAAGYNLARLQIDRGEYGAARALLETMVSADRENLLLLETLAYARFLEGDFAGARLEYRSILHIAPARSRAAYNLALLENHVGAFDDAFQILETHLVFAEQDPEYRWLLADAAHRSNRETRALAELEYLRGLAQDDAEQLTRLLSWYVERDYFLAALEIVDKAPETLADNQEFQFLAATALLLGTEDFPAGRARLELAIDTGFADAARLEALLEKLSADERESLQSLVPEGESPQ